jgi:hypothetical protein
MDDQLHVPHDIYTRLVDAAQTEGTTPVGWIEQRLPTAASMSSDSQVAKLTDERLEQMRKDGKTVLEMLGDLVGSIHSGGQARASERHSELFVQGMEEKRREGRL